MNGMEQARKRLPDRRRTVRETISFQGMRICVDAGLDRSLRVRETFLRPVGLSEVGRNDLFDEIGITISRALQSGLGLADLVTLYPDASPYIRGLVGVIGRHLSRAQCGIDWELAQ